MCKKKGVAEAAHPPPLQKKKTLDLVREARAGLRDPRFKNLNPEGALMEILRRYGKTIAGIANRARLAGISNDLEELRQRGIFGLLLAINGAKGEITRRWYKYASDNIAGKVFRGDLYDYRAVAVDIPDGEKEDDWSLLDVVAPNREDPAAILERKEKFAKMWRLVNYLPRPQRLVLVLRYKRGFTLKEAGILMGGLTRERVRQIEAQALANVKRIARGMAA